MRRQPEQQLQLQQVEKDAPNDEWKMTPRSFRDPAAIVAARSLLGLPHMAPLTKHAAELRIKLGRDDVPDFDPLGGGVSSTALILMEAPPQ